MRLTCPNCGAQYEVPDEVIPETGRDVQCSNCGDTWFQNHPDQAVAGDTTDDGAAPSDETSAGEPATEPGPGEDHPARRRIDPEVADVLREEAERERQARARGGEGLETQPELGVDGGASTSQDEADRRAREARMRMSRLKGEPEDETPDDAEDLDPGSRRNLLPDIDEINSSLSSSTASERRLARVEAEDAELLQPETSRGFGRGFLLVVLLAFMLLLLYVLAPLIAESVPELRPYLASYVDAVNAARLWLNRAVAGLLVWINEMTGG